MNINNFYIVIMWVIAIVLVIADVKQLKKIKAIKTTYNLDEYEMFDYSKSQKLMMIFFAVAIVVTAVASYVSAKSGLEKQSTLQPVLIELAMLVMTGVEYITSKNCMRFYYNDKNIIYEGDLIRLKSIKSISKTGKRGRNYSMVTYDGHSYAIHEQSANVIQKQIDLMKEEKKEKKKK